MTLTIHLLGGGGGGRIEARLRVCLAARHSPDSYFYLYLSFRRQVAPGVGRRILKTTSQELRFHHPLGSLRQNLQPHPDTDIQRAMCLSIDFGRG